MVIRSLSDPDDPRDCGQEVFLCHNCVKCLQLRLEQAEKEHSLDESSMKVTFRGGYVEDEAGDRWWSHGLLSQVERERNEARAELAFIQTEYAAANESDLTRDALCLQLAALKHELRMATERAAIAGRERDEAVALNQAMNRLRAHGSAKRCACQWEAGDSPCPVHGEEER